MTAKVNDKGEVVVKLPASGQTIKLRAPKGKDLKVLEQVSKAPDATNVGLMMHMAVLLDTSQGLTVDALDEMDSEDVLALGEALSNFRFFSKS